MKNPTDLGMNRTGVDLSPIDSKEMLAEANRIPPSSEGDETQILEARSQYVREAFPIGSIPPPGKLRGVLQTGIQKLALNKPEVLIDKLGERLGFERMGTRLYEALISKCQSRIVEHPELPIAELQQFRNEEAQHFDLVRKAIETLGGDPTALTPCADTSAVASMGVAQVILDPRTSVAQSIEALLIAELVDHDGWELLIRLTEGLGLQKMASSFRQALNEEAVHLETVRGILQKLTLRDAGVAA